VAVHPALAKPGREVGGFFALSLDMFVALFTTRFSWHEFIEQSWFVARVSLFPCVSLTIPFNALVVFILNVLLFDIGAADASGTAAAFSVMTQTGPFTTVLVVGGAAATAMCADLGARTIREEIDAMRVMGIDPAQRLFVPRVVALTVNALLLNGVVCFVGLAASYVFAVYVNNVTPGSFAASLTLLVGLPATVISFVKAALFGLTAGLIACYKGLTVGGGPQGVGNAVNETVVYTFMALAVINTLVTTIGTTVSSR
jgi:phospholipid/cholesterol/gamma-HCH transport system permease protein